MADPFERIASYYGELVDEHGHDPRACDYGNPGAQQTKFRVLAEVMSLAGRRVLDVGCGFADWAGWLRQHVGAVAYTGIDIAPAMVAEAKRNHPELDLRVANILDDDVTGSFDLVTANGIFYLLGDDAQQLMERMIAKMYAMSEVATAFTTLSGWADVQDEGEFYADPVATVAFCRTLTPWVVLRHDYHHRDFAVYLYREQQT